MAGNGGRWLVIVPAFNEAGTIARVIGRIRATDAGLDVAVVDDGSTDETAHVARAAGARVLRLPFNLGYGAALQTGYKFALRGDYDGVVQIDGDGQHEPADIPALLAVLERGEADVALGSRFIGATSYRPKLLQSVGMWAFGALAWALGGARLSDVTSGFQALNRDVVGFFVADRYPADYPDADVLMMLGRAGFRIKEVPVRMYDRATGRSMHAGLRPIYYVFKMLLSMSVTRLRREVAERGSA